MPKARVTPRTKVQKQNLVKTDQLPKKRLFQKEKLDDSHEAAVKLLRDSSHSDVVVICRDRSWKCQRAILCQRCPFFEAALSGPFQEGLEHKIDLSEDDPEAVDVLLLYLYTFTYNVYNPKTLPKGGSPGPVNIIPGLRLSIHVFYTADKYQIPKLKEAAHNEIKDWFKHNKFMTLYHKDDPRSIEIYRCVKEFWSLSVSDTDDIKEIVIDEMMKDAKDTLDDVNLQNLLREEPSFMMQYLSAVTKKLP